MRHINLGESTVMQEFERIAAANGWIATAEDKDMKKRAEEPVSEHVPVDLVKEPHRSELGKISPPATPLQDIDKMLAGVQQPEAAGYQGSLIQQVQKALQEALGGDVLGPKGPEGMWGWFTSRAWNTFAKKHPEAGLPQTTERQAPPNAVLRKMLGASGTPAPAAGKEEMPLERAPLHLIKEPHMTQPWQYPSGPELVPKASVAIVNELIALANDLDQMGETKIAEAIDKELALYKEAVDKLYDITGETGEQLVGEAHPGGGPTMVPAKEEGGKVETIVEQQKRNLKVVDKKPTGKQAAFVAKQLVALANRLDAEGKTEAALLVDKTLDELREGSPRPFVGTSKTAAAGIIEAIQNFIDAIDGVDVQHKEKLTDIRKTLLRAKQDIYNARVARDKAPSQKLKNGWAAAEAQKVIELDNESASWWSMIEENLSWQWAGAIMMSDTQKLGRAIRTLKAAIVAERSAKQELFYQVENQLEAAAPQPPVPGAKPAPAGTDAPKTGEPAPQAAKIEEDPENKKAHDKFIGTINTLIRAIMAKRGETEKLFGGPEKLDKQLGWLVGLRKTPAPTNELERLRLMRNNDKIWNYYMKAFQSRGLVPKAFAKAPVKVAADPPKKPPAASAAPAPAVPAGGQPLVTTTPPGQRTTTAPHRTKGVAKKVNENLRQLQNAMMAMSIPLPAHQADGRWGPETWRAWNTLRDAIIERKGPGWDIGRPPAPAGNGPGDNAINAALNMAKHLRRLQSARTTVNIARGVQVPERSLANAQAFIKALSAQPNSGVSPKGTPREQVAAALKLAQAYALALEEQDSDESWSLVREDVDRNARTALVDNLVGQLKALETGIPSYRLPGGAGAGGIGGRQPYGRGEGVGELGTLEGGPGRGGRSREYGGRSGRSGRPEPEMSIEDQVYTLTQENIPTNDAQQALYWAYNFWTRHAGQIALPQAKKNDWYAIAHAVIKFLRIEIARLSGTPEVRKSTDLSIELRRLYEAVTEMEQLLRGR